MAPKLVDLLFQSWADLDLSVAGLTDDEAAIRFRGCNKIAWSVGHVTQQIESWINRRFLGLPPHPLISQPIFHTGASGEAPNFFYIQTAVAEIREPARRFLDSVGEDDLDQTVPYDGSLADLRATGLSLSYALLRISSHHFLHVGEIHTIRSLLNNPAEEPASWGQAMLPKGPG